jgi:hypothetical protein
LPYLAVPVWSEIADISVVPYVTVGGFGDNEQLLHQLTEADSSPKTALSQDVAISTSTLSPVRQQIGSTDPEGICGRAI